MRRVVLGLLWALGCSTSLGTVGTLSPADGSATKLLRPGAEGRSCRASVLGVPLEPGQPTLREALGRILALDDEGDVVTDAEVVCDRLVTGLYNRRCIVVRGDLARTISTLVLPSSGHHH